MYTLFLIYVLVSLFVGYLGRGKLIGFVGYFTLSLLLTPIVMGLVLFLSLPRQTSA